MTTIKTTEPVWCLTCSTLITKQSLAYREDKVVKCLHCVFPLDVEHDGFVGVAEAGCGETWVAVREARSPSITCVYKLDGRHPGGNWKTLFPSFHDTEEEALRELQRRSGLPAPAPWSPTAGRAACSNIKLEN